MGQGVTTTRRAPIADPHRVIRAGRDTDRLVGARAPDSAPPFPRFLPQVPARCQPSGAPALAFPVSGSVAAILGLEAAAAGFPDSIQGV